MKIITIGQMKINEVEEMSSVHIGQTLSQGVHTKLKNNQSFGNETSDGTIHIRSYGKINDSDVCDRVSRHVSHKHPL